MVGANLVNFWSIGALECWSVGVVAKGLTSLFFQHSNTPSLQYSTADFLFIVLKKYKQYEEVGGHL